jgi:hypothetical protein
MPSFNPNQERPSVWTLMKGGTHARIVKALLADDVVVNAVKAKLAHPDDNAARDHLLDIITRRTGNCIGQAIAGKSLAPEDEMLTIFRLLPSSTAGAISTAIGGSQATHNALATGDVTKIVTPLSRMVGRCVFQAVVGKVGSFGLGDIAGELLRLAGL